MKETKWYIDPRDDPHTSETITIAIPDVIEHKEMKCADGKKRSLFELPSHQALRRVERARAGAQMTLFHVYKGVDGDPPERWRFTPVKRHLRKGPAPETHKAP